MTIQSHLPRMKDISTNTPVTVTLPAHVWLGFLASYGNAKWGCAYTSSVALAAQEELMDPVWLKEREAEHAEGHDAHQMILKHLLGADPDIPPNMTD